MKRMKGSLTIEAALALPLFLMAILSIIYFNKIIFIQENIQYAIDETANEIAAYAYLFEKTDIINTQQLIYEEANKNITEVENSIQTIIANGQYIYDVIGNINTYIIPKNTEGNSKDGFKATNKKDQATLMDNTISHYLDETVEIKESISANIQDITLSISEIMTTTYDVMNNLQGVLIDGYISEGLQVTNNIVGTKMVESLMSKHISEEEYNNWYIVDGKEGMNYKHSTFMLENDNIDIIVTYKVKIPIPFPGFREIDMIQRVTVRGWVGDERESKTTHFQENSNEEDKNQSMVYITRTGNHYHEDGYCTYLKVKTYEVLYKEIKNVKTPCKICSVDQGELSDNTKVLISASGKRYHIDANCWEINKETFMISFKEAIEEYDPCSKCSEGE